MANADAGERWTLTVRKPHVDSGLAAHSRTRWCEAASCRQSGWGGDSSSPCGAGSPSYRVGPPYGRIHQ